MPICPDPHTTCRCPAPSHSLSHITLPELNTEGGCLHDVLAAASITLSDVVYHAETDQIALKGRYGILPHTTVMLSKQDEAASVVELVGPAATELATYGLGRPRACARRPSGLQGQSLGHTGPAVPPVRACVRRRHQG